MSEKYSNYNDKERATEKDRRVKLNINLENLVTKTIQASENASGKKWNAKRVAEYTSEEKRAVQKYEKLDMTLKIDDEPVRRICQVLTNEGFTTTDSCEGHGEKLPHIFFECDDQTKLRELAHIISRASLPKNFIWHIRLWSGDPGLNPDMPLNFVLEPNQPDDLDPNRIIDPKKNHSQLLEDLDIIGLRTMQHFDLIRSKYTI